MAFVEVFDLFRTCRDRHKRVGRSKSGGTVRVAVSAIEIKAAVPNDSVFNTLYWLPMAGLMVRNLRPLRDRNVAAARRCS